MSENIRLPALKIAPKDGQGIISARNSAAVPKGSHVVVVHGSIDDDDNDDFLLL